VIYANGNDIAAGFVRRKNRGFDDHRLGRYPGTRAARSEIDGASLIPRVKTKHGNDASDAKTCLPSLAFFNVNEQLCRKNNGL
jgi:hypothetical protein